MNFHNERRQQFLGEQCYKEGLNDLPASIEYFSRNPFGSGSSPEERDALSRLTCAEHTMDYLVLKYTAGEKIDPLRVELENVVNAYDRYGHCMWMYSDRDEPVFSFTSLDDYSVLMQLIGLCFLLHRRDLLPCIAALQDGADEENGGTDTLYEELMAHGLGPETRYESDYLCCSRPYESLFHALTELTPEARLSELHIYLKRWYKDLGGCAWHDAHKLNEKGEQNGYYGYWSFEAGAAVVLLGIEDDSSLHQYLYYPKDLVAWCRAHAAEYPNGGLTPTGIIRQTSVRAGEVCPKTGWWFTMAKANSLRYFQQGVKFPNIEGSDYGLTFWQWSQDQLPPPMI